ncbi:MAG: FkbM family methyltransferase [Verrucomicrobiaceae bacterium]|nr:FkbM family methyltransferase [Verrucomicrobiaceae bacterium]
MIRRILWELKRPQENVVVQLPWGLHVSVSPHDRIGSSILKTGTYDTAVLECLYRLVDEGELCLDVGANFGLMTSVMAIATGEKGKVIAFEPHPEIALSLQKHIELWQNATPPIGTVQAVESAVSEANGTAELEIPREFNGNRGTARISHSTGSKEEVAEIIRVETIRLDDFLRDTQSKVGMLKIDIEGHEKTALSGAAGLLKRGAIRDIIYEGETGYPSSVSKYLEEFGYKIYLIRKGLLKPMLMPPGTPLYELGNFLATRDPQRAETRLGKKGYRILNKLR